MPKLEDRKKDSQIWGLEDGKIIQIVSYEPVGAIANKTRQDQAK